MATVTHPIPHLDASSVSMDRDEILALIETEARLIGLSLSEAIERTRKGHTGSGYIWDDISLLVSLLE